MTVKALLTLLVLAATALAGCADGGSGEAPSDDDLNLGDTPRATAQTGVIIGVVVDESIIPLEGATVSLEGTTKSAVTNEKGAFAFGELEPATYFVKVAKPGYFTAQQSIDVVAGVETPDVVRFLLETDVEARPYVMSFVFEGYIECSVTLVAVGFAACSLLDEVEAGNDHFNVEHELDRAPTFAQSEMVWQSTQALGNNLDILYSWDCGEPFLCDHTASGGSPLVLRANETVLEEAGFDQATPLLIRVFNSDVPETRPPCIDEAGICPWGVGATLNQEFTVYTHVFYNMLPPEDWQFSQDGDPPAVV